MDYYTRNSCFIFCVAASFLFAIVSSLSQAQLPVDHSHHRNLKLLPRKCGHQLTKDRIHNGMEAEIYEFPWAVALQTREGKFDCGGSLINKRFVLTAAHCVHKQTMVRIRLGERGFDKQQDCGISQRGRLLCAPPYQEVEILKTIIHPGFIYRLLINDIALLKLKKPVQINDERSRVLMKAEVPLQILKKCRGIIGQYGQLCAGGVNKTDVCYGDSGGPLMGEFVANGRLRVIQYGIVSYGSILCGNNGSPTTYTNVVPYVGWILDNLRE